MKNLKFLIVVIISTLFIACGSDDESVDESSLIVGDWNLVSMEYNGEANVTNTADGSMGTFPFTGEAINIETSFTFNEDPENFTTSIPYDVILTTILSEETVIETTQIEGFGFAFSKNGTYTIQGDQLNITTTNGEEGMLSILTLTENSLILKFISQFEFTNENTIQISDVEATYSFTK